MKDDPETPVTAGHLVARATELATLPDIYIQIRQILDNPASSHADIANALATDTALTGRLLRVANSAFYGRPGSISTISAAIGLLGTQQVHDLVLANAVIHALEGFSSDLMDRRTFWSTSLFTASAAKILAEQCDILDSERLFVAGLLASVGLLILCQELPQQMRIILDDARQPAQDIAALQRERLGFDHAEVGAKLFSTWQLPDALVMPIGMHTQPATAKETRLESSILYIAARLAETHTRQVSLDLLVPELSDDAWDTTGMSMEQLRQVERDARDLTAELTPLLLAA